MNSQSGLSLTETLIAFALTAALGLGVVKYITSATKVGSSRAFLEDTRDLRQKIISGLGSKENCEMNFKGNPANGFTFGQVMMKLNGTPVAIAKTNQNWGTNLKMIKMELEDRPGMSDGVEIINGDVGSTNLKITFEKSNRLMNTENPVAMIKLIVYTDSTGVIESCHASTSGEDQLWKVSSKDPTKIYYSSGNVGVGTNEPGSKLDVAGNIIAQNAAGERITLGGQPARFQLDMSADKVLEVWNEVTNAPGTLEAGTIRADYITLTASTEACTPLNEGAIMFDAGKVNVCEGGFWKQKEYVTWCTPPREIKKGHDEWMKFHQTTDYRPKGFPCDASQIRKKMHAKLVAPGFRIKYDDRSKSCSNDRNCIDYNPGHQ